MPADLDLRKLRYFVAVAEELNFGRAAERLHIAQPVLSRQIRALEDDLHIALLLRDSHGTTLTGAGAQLLIDARIVLDDASLIRRRLARFQHSDLELLVGVMPGLLATRAISDFQDDVPGCRVNVIRLGWNNQVDSVRSGAVDVAYARDLPELPGLVVRELVQEPRDVVLPIGHRLASQSSITPSDLRNELLLQDAAVAPEWLAEASPSRRRDAAAGPAADTVEEKLELVAAGRGFIVLPRSTTAAYRRPDVVVVPAVAFAPSRVCLLWRADDLDPIRDRFITAAIGQTENALAG
ncbi:LysR family transcriptional regulator [Frondihabitans sucicola]|uniref:LysR family transcriptional regulator n=1 Tax=Frondihabitans sucicola TaxID=1268041 RepID=A0ABN6XXG0_9MICO|nr:LysR substrate-binding domain-containing protein [Frondihabitans sucicola]BDZ49722.1 LysR family transcriptional regulator [Frondihabitans sucicola]